MTSTRKGIRNQLKTLLFRKSSQPETPRAGQGLSQYGPGSVEGQMRLLADLAFMMQDYETAISTLRLLSSDFKADKAWRPYAAAQVGAHSTRIANTVLPVCTSETIEPFCGGILRVIHAQ